MLYLCRSVFLFEFIARKNRAWTAFEFSIHFARITKTRFCDKLVSPLAIYLIRPQRGFYHLQLTKPPLPVAARAFMVRPTGVEPAASRVGVLRSIQLSYGRILKTALRFLIRIYALRFLIRSFTSAVIHRRNRYHKSSNLCAVRQALIREDHYCTAVLAVSGAYHTLAFNAAEHHRL